MVRSSSVIMEIMAGPDCARSGGEKFDDFIVHHHSQHKYAESKNDVVTPSVCPLHAGIALKRLD